MRKILIAVMAVVSMFWFASPTHATLYDRGGGLIYDDHLDITWLQDANYAGFKNWYQAVAWAESLDYYDSVRKVTWSDWRLPTTVGGHGYNITTSEMGYMYYVNLGNKGWPEAGWDLKNTGPFINIYLTPGTFWSGTEYSLGYAWYFNFNLGRQGDTRKDHKYYRAWAVRPGDVVSAPVPEPATMLLLGSGLLGLAGYARKRFRK